MSQPISVDVTAMQQAVTEFDSTHSAIQGQVQNLQSEFDALASTWSGDAASTFQSAMSSFYDECNTILSNLSQISQEVTSSANNYQQTHLGSVDSVTNLRNGLQAPPGQLLTPMTPRTGELLPTTPALPGF